MLTTRSALRRTASKLLPVRESWTALIVVFLGLHLLLGWINLTDHVHRPFGDVDTIYLSWIGTWQAGGPLVGIDQGWVYPIAALLPMIASIAFGPEHYGLVWSVLIGILDLGALLVLRRRSSAAAWWWTAFLALLGPIAVGRIDAVTVPLALVAVLLLVRRPIVASALLTFATWIKVWPAALIGALLVVGFRPRRIALAAVATSAAVLLVAAFAGGASHALSFVTEQTGRGVQIEAPIATPWLLAAVFGHAQVYYDTGILTFQVQGKGVHLVAAAMTPVLAATVLVLVGLTLLARRRGVAALDVLPHIALAFTTALIAVNKVGSPQYISWLAVPFVLGLLTPSTNRVFRAMSMCGMAIAALTQIIYPWFYDSLTQAQAWMVGVIVVRNLLELGLLAWSAWQLANLADAPAWFRRRFVQTDLRLASPAES